MNTRGFTLMEVILTALLLAIFAGVATQVMDSQQNARKYEETRAKLDAIAQAIWGDASVNNRGQRTRFGYYGDMGQLPTTLNDLITQGAQTAWAFNTTYGVGVGWRGPYYHENLTGAYNIKLDAWGHALNYNTSVTPNTITSFGSDGAAGGTGYAQDLVLVLNANRYQATISGYVKDATDSVNTTTVQITYPSAGALTQAQVNPNGNGSFSFSGVTMGPVAIQTTTGTPLLGPKIIVVDTPQYFVPNTTLNYFGDWQAVVYQGGVFVNGSGNQNVHVPINNGYEYNLTLKAITVWYDTPGAYLHTVNINGSNTKTWNGGARPTSGVRATTNASLFSSNRTRNLNLSFQDASGANIDMTGANWAISLEWNENNRIDAITFAT